MRCLEVKKEQFASWTAVLVSFLLCSLAGLGSVSAQELGDRIQSAVGNGNTASATFDQAPKPGNFLVAVSVHRVSWNEAYISGNGWNQAFEVAHHVDDNNNRRGMAMWYKTVGENEPLTVETFWLREGSSSDGDRTNSLLIMEFEGNFIRDTAASWYSPQGNSTGAETGLTDMATETPSLVVSASVNREASDLGTWTNGLDDNIRYVAQSFVTGGSDMTIQSAYKLSNELKAWDAEITWGNTSGASAAGIAVFRPFEETEWLFDCGSQIKTEVSITKGAAMLMLDRSASMEYLFSEECTVNVCCYNGYDGADNCPGPWDRVASREAGASMCSRKGSQPVVPDSYPSIQGSNTYHWNSNGTVRSIRCGSCNFNNPSALPRACCYERVQNVVDESSPITGAFCGENLWDVAKDSIQAVVTTMQNELDFGLGLFYGASTATINVEATNPDFVSAIQTVLNQQSPGNFTPTPEAMTAIAGSQTLSLPGSAGVLITDGIPMNSSGARYTETIAATCAARHSGATNYIVGLGGATNVGFNNLQAAAAGTGCCGAQANDECSNGIGFDPCDGPSIRAGFDVTDSEFWGTCSGSYSAANFDEFTEVLLQIGRQISCTFPLDTSGWPDGIPDDYRAVDVLTSGLNGNQRVAHRSTTNSGEGWYFANSDRTAISFTENFCNQIAVTEEITSVTTDVACSCFSEFEGNDCLLSNVISTACPVGRKVCNPDQTWFCQGPANPMGPDCPFFNCPEWTEPVLCHTGNTLSYNHGPPGQGGGSFNQSNDFDPELELNRCEVGVLVCTDEDGAYCRPLSPMPDICNGLDNSCDGKIGNFRESWTNQSDHTLTGNAEGAACNLEDICVCPQAPMTHGGLDAVFQGLDMSAEFTEYIDDYLEQLGGDSCYCQPL